MLRDCDWSLDRDYKTGSENEPIQFYLDGLANSNEFNLLLGYFSSAAINLMSVGFATFISKGGKMRLVINHLLSKKDKAVIQKAESGINNKVFNLSDVVSLNQVLDDYDLHFFECLAYLISQKRIEIKVIKPKDGKGIAHYKSGVFSDGIDSVGYKASCNFTVFGLSENLEELEAFLSWENGRSNKLIKKQLQIIDDYFDEKDDDVEYVPAENIEIVIKERFGNKEISELLIQEEQLLNKKSKLISNKRTKATITKLFEEIDIIRRKPKFPFPQGPRDYQIEAYENWVNNNFKGIFAMATGTGKTITSLNCVLQEGVRNGYYQAFILVPTITLVNQWVDEVKAFNFQNIYCISSKVDWKKEITTMLAQIKRVNKSFIIICTYASFTKDSVQALFPLLPNDTILIADEGHNIASQRIRKLMPKVNLNKLIGLSATPKRIYDEEGTLAMESFFNDSEPYTYVFSMEKAIKEGILTKYEYFPHIINLSNEEFEEYYNETKKLAKFFDSETGSLREGADKILLKRKRIVQKAVGKLDLLREILKERFKKDGNLNYSFVYAPEGIVKENYDLSEVWEDDPRIIDLYLREIAMIDESITVNKYVSDMAFKNDIIEQFKNGNIQVLASMKCLDEGVDIPRAEYAIFCSSTGNPRQFIQRRGRILRRHADKHKAIVHDMVVIPKMTSSETYDVERKLVIKELERVMYFASLSENFYYTEDIFKEICEFYDLNLYTIQANLKML